LGTSEHGFNNFLHAAACGTGYKKVETRFSNLRAESQSAQGTMLTDQSIKGLQFCGGLKIQR
jgi:hypothetical protein